MGFHGSGDYKLDLLRSWRLCRDASDICVANRQQRLVAALAIRGPTLPNCLAGLLWPNHPNSRALESLRVSVHLISRQAPGLIVNEGASLSLTGQVDVDLYRVKAQTRTLAEDCSSVTVSMFAELRDAELLSGWYEDWVCSNRTACGRTAFMPSLRHRRSYWKRAISRLQGQLRRLHWKSNPFMKLPLGSSSRPNCSTAILPLRSAATRGTGHNLRKIWGFSLPSHSKGSSNTQFTANPMLERRASSFRGAPGWAANQCCTTFRTSLGSAVVTVFWSKPRVCP